MVPGTDTLALVSKRTPTVSQVPATVPLRGVSPPPAPLSPSFGGLTDRSGGKRGGWLLYMANSLGVLFLVWSGAMPPGRIPQPSPSGGGLWSRSARWHQRGAAGCLA
jgi:hypothetical protein